MNEEEAWLDKHKYRTIEGSENIKEWFNWLDYLLPFAGFIAGLAIGFLLTI